MKLAESILLSLSVAFFIIGVHQTFVLGIVQSYWLFMLSVSMLLLLKLTKGKAATEPDKSDLSRPKRQARKDIKPKVKSPR
jgi:hypothetical protein